MLVLVLALMAPSFAGDVPDSTGVEAAASEEPAAPAVDPATLPTVHAEGVVGPDSPHFDLEVLYHQSRFEEGLEIAKERLAADPSDPVLYWMTVRFMFEIGEGFQRNDPSVDKKAWYTDMIAVSEEGLRRFPTDKHILFGFGIGKARLGTTRGVLSSLFMAKDVEQSWLSVAESSLRYSSLGGEELLPCDAMQSVGIFYRLVPDWWIVKLLAGTRGDLDKSLEFLTRADACYAGRTSVVKELGVTQLCIGSVREDDAMIAAGKATLERMLLLPVEVPTDLIDQKHAQMLIADPSLACEYSRDGQQELDEETLESSK